LLLRRVADEGIFTAETTTAGARSMIENKPEILRTLPAFYHIQGAGPCPQQCAFCPYPRRPSSDFMNADTFNGLLDRIAAFSGSAVIDLSLWGEIALHPDKTALIRAALDHPGLSLVIETAGLGWRKEELDEAHALSAAAMPRKDSPRAPLSWIVSLDAWDADRYAKVRGSGYAEAVETAVQLIQLFPKDCYVQAVRVQDSEDDIENFYRQWKSRGANVIIQKYDDFCGVLPHLQTADLSPVKRRPCWHLMRDMNILIDGTVPLCAEMLNSQEEVILGNVFRDSLETIWQNGEAAYRSHCAGDYARAAAQCPKCDEYYTFNF
jgi:spiro-SPASM protein